MSFSTPSIRLSFQAKVLIPVIALLVLLPALTVLLIQHSSLAQLHREARQKLNTADAVFKNSLEIRASHLVSRYRNIVNEPRFKADAQLADPRTMRTQLNDLLDELGGDAEVMMMVDPAGRLLAGARKGNELRIETFHSASHDAVISALQGQPEAHVIALEDTVLNVISVPVTVNLELIGALVVGEQLGENVVQQLTSLTLGEVALFADGAIAASSLPHGDFRDELLQVLGSSTHSSARQPRVHDILLGGMHYLAFVGEFPTAGRKGLGYILLSSYEQELQQLQTTQNWLWALSLLGALLSTGVVWLAVGRIMRPLHDLRNTAEAVGRGDFSQRVVVGAKDEVGQLAHTFNQMTRNLQNSHTELQRTLQTLKSTQAQLIQSEKLSAVGEFVAGIAHELNNPLTSVIGFGELLKQTELSQKQTNFVNCIVKSSERCHKIVQGLLSFARQSPPERKPLKLNETVSTVVDLMAYELRTSNIEVRIEAPEEFPYVMGDPHQLQQVFLNILNNSRQAMEGQEHPGRMRIVLETAGALVRMRFEDNGPGIPKENLARIFDPFFTTKPVGKGTGLGLSLCYGIIQEHGGTISAEAGVRGGAVFTIDLPVCQKTELPANRVVGDDPAGFSGEGRRVLVIDDEVWILDLIRQILQRDGFEVDTVSDGKAALDHVSQSRYELLVCDWKMPGLSGPQLYDRLTSLAPDTASRTIFMTGDVVSDTFQKFLQQHAKTCLSKPFSVQEFRQAVSSFLAERESTAAADSR